MRHSSRWFSFSSRMAIAVLTILCSGAAYAASGTWNGTDNGYWTNSANWSVAPYPSGADTASFTNAGNSKTTIDLTGLSSIKSITFDTTNVASYTIGSGGANAQMLVAPDAGQITLATAAAADQTIAAAVQMQGNYTFANNNAARTLTFNSVTNTSVDKTLTFLGTGAISLLGNLSASNLPLSVSANGTGTLTLSGTNNQLKWLQINGDNAVINLSAGSLTTFNDGGGDNLNASRDAVINGPGAIKLSSNGSSDPANNWVANGKTLTINAKLTGSTGLEYWHNSNFGTIALGGQNDFTLNVIMNAAGTFSVTNVGNQGSTTSNLGSGQKVTFNSSSGGPSCLRYTGAGEQSNRILEFSKDGIVEQAGVSGNMKFTSDVASAGNLTMTLRGSTAGTGEIAGAIPSSTSVAKTGTGTWYLSGSNTYSGATTVNSGNLVLCGAKGAIRSSSGLSLAGGSFVLLNSATTNSADRIGDSVPVILNGGTFCFSNDLTMANFSEALGTLTVNSSNSTVAALQAADGGTSTVRFASVVRLNTDATVNFTGAGLGDSDRNRIFITTQGDGLIGTWATVNGTSYAAYSSSRGVYASLGSVVDIAARGYSVITNDATLIARISLPGENGPIVLQTSPVSSVGSLSQNSTTPAVVTTTNTLLKLSEIIVAADKESLTVGTVPGEGTLSTLSPGGSLSLENNSSNKVLTVNANVVANTAACGLTKLGAGKVVLAGQNTYAGPTFVRKGEFVFGGGNHAIGQLSVGDASFFLTNAAASLIYVSTNSAFIGYNAGEFGRMAVGGNCVWSDYPFLKYSNQTSLVIGNSGRGILTLQDNASVTQRLYVGNNSGSAGAVYQNGGVMHNWGGANCDARIGMYGYGYYELNSGTFTNNGYTQIGWDPQAVGILKQTGGAFKMGNVYDGYLGISRGGTGVVYLAGGTFNSSAQLNVGESLDNSTTKGFAEFTVAGGAADINGNVYMADRDNMFAAVNLKGGTLAANMISRAARATSLALVNFDGGTFRARASGQLFGTGTGAPNAVNIFGGGATVDTPAGLSCAIAVPLLAPAGSGVTAIGVTPRGGYIGPPMVTIAGGGGTGATAVAQFDAVSNSVSGILMTCPGFGYTSNPTATLSGGGTNVQTTVTGYTRAANVSGGLTKIGLGGLTLSATNTYSGATTISNGFLRLGVAQGVPTNSALRIAGGTFDLGGLSYTNGMVTVTGGGTIVNGALTSGGLIQTGGGTLTLGASLGSPAPVRIDAGVLQMQPMQAGLYEAALAGSFNTTDPNPCTNRTLTTRAANTSSMPPWASATTFVYTGYLWNRATTNVTWTFAENVDDNTRLIIDGTTLIADGIAWATPTIGTMTLSPGAHFFEARFGNGVGGAGVVDGTVSTALSWWKTNAFGFGVDYLGRNDTNIANYVALADPGDGSLLTLFAASGGLTNRISPAASVELGTAGVLDLGTNTQSQTLANLSGSGIVSNGVLAVTGAIAPGGTNAVGWLTVAKSAGLSGKLLMDVALDGTSDRLVIVGNMNISGLSLEIANSTQLNHQKQYTLVTCTGTRTGTFSSVTVPNNRWHVIYSADGTVKLIFVDGTLISVR